MCPLRSLLLISTLVLLHHLPHLSLGRSLPTTTAGPGTSCLDYSQNLLRAVSNTLQKARQTLEFYSCTSEEIDHEDITKDKTSTVEACLPLELATTLCLRSIYKDLKMYHMEFQAMNAKLLMDPKRQVFLDQNMLAAIAELMQALNFDSETVPQKPSLEELDFYKTKVKLCILLHAFRIRAVTIDRMMSYLSSS
ncbi:hypothetical protein MJG53_000825 [Ovis ammon polii x Ovis aries]|uniref:Uncharacterized protein n=1 Tax=Ovis ammon polii x Ovis aries TaxID=2918886 RepID=A0ACB9VJY5_9CETA|nr:hypothetical protein MJT46_000316 [Ovis ammon polii x Ovis aries]KAI4589776.1 hypothetical protein MJG53_000825 [Ovis ammon polii x Ovis aries]